MKGVANTAGAGRIGADYGRRKAAQSRGWYYRQVKEGKCVRCADGDPPTGWVMCDRCAEGNRLALRALRERDKAAGRCTRCHVDNARKGRSTCAGCVRDQAVARCAKAR